MYSASYCAPSSSADPSYLSADAAPTAASARPQTDSLIYPPKAIPRFAAAEERSVQPAAAWILHCSMLPRVRGLRTALQYCALSLRSAKLSALRRLPAESFC